jgi:hypothetical protein
LITGENSGGEVDMDYPAAERQDAWLPQEQLNELRDAAEAITEWCGEGLECRLNEVDTLRCFADILSCVDVALTCVAHLAQAVQEAASSPGAVAAGSLPADISGLTRQLTQLVKAEQRTAIPPLVKSCRQLADRLDA